MGRRDPTGQTAGGSGQDWRESFSRRATSEGRAKAFFGQMVVYGCLGLGRRDPTGQTAGGSSDRAPHHAGPREACSRLSRTVAEAVDPHLPGLVRVVRDLPGVGDRPGVVDHSVRASCLQGGGYLPVEAVLEVVILLTGRVHQRNTPHYLAL